MTEQSAPSSHMSSEGRRGRFDGRHPLAAQPGAEPVSMVKGLRELDWRRAILVCSIAAAFAFLGTFLLGFVSDAKAIELIEAIKPTTRILCFAAISAPGTVLALLLTMVSISRGWKKAPKSDYYDRIRQISAIAAVSIVAGVFLLLFLNIPVQESPALRDWYAVLYYVVITYAALLGALVVTMTFMLYATVWDLVAAVDPHVDSSDLFDD